MVYFTIYHSYLRKINNRKKDTLDNLKKVWTTDDFEFNTFEEAKTWCLNEGYKEYRIYKTELIEEAQQ